MQGTPIQLRHDGRRMVGDCPFHKHPSATLAVAEGLYYCFACNRGGPLAALEHEGYRIVVVAH